MLDDTSPATGTPTCSSSMTDGSSMPVIGGAACPAKRLTSCCIMCQEDQFELHEPKTYPSPRRFFLFRLSCWSLRVLARMTARACLWLSLRLNSTRRWSLRWRLAAESAYKFSPWRLRVDSRVHFRCNRSRGYACFRWHRVQDDLRCGLAGSYK